MSGKGILRILAAVLTVTGAALIAYTGLSRSASRFGELPFESHIGGTAGPTGYLLGAGCVILSIGVLVLTERRR